MTLVVPDMHAPAAPYLTPNSYESPVFGVAISATAVFPTANQAFYIPLYITTPFVITRLFSVNGTAVAGNVDVGVYLPDVNKLPGAKLVSSGSTAQAGTAVCQYFDVTDTWCPSGLIYLALSCSSTTAQFYRHAPGVEATAFPKGLMSEASALPLPATATPVAAASAYVPMCGIVRPASP